MTAIEFLVPFTLGAVIGFAFATAERRKKLMAKLNDWTKPKKTEDKPEEPVK